MVLSKLVWYFSLYLARIDKNIWLQLPSRRQVCTLTPLTSSSHAQCIRNSASMPILSLSPFLSLSLSLSLFLSLSLSLSIYLSISLSSRCVPQCGQHARRELGTPAVLLQRPRERLCGHLQRVQGHGMPGVRKGADSYRCEVFHYYFYYHY